LKRKPQGLRKLSPDAIAKARDNTEAHVNRIQLTLVGAAVFCLLALLTPDSALLVGGSEKLNVPFAGSVSFFGFVLLAPAVLIVVRVYLEIYVQHERRLDRLARSMPAARVPMLIPNQNSLLRAFKGLTLYLLLPLTMLAFWWKAAVFAVWSLGLLIVAAAVIVAHVILLCRSFSWRSTPVIALCATILTVAVTVGTHSGFKGPLRRPFNLFRANLSDQWLASVDLTEADLRYANLARAYLLDTNLIGADLSNANLSGADLIGADLSHANLSHANLKGVNRGASRE